MTHRVEQIIDAMTEVINSVTPSTVKVYAHRRLSLSEDQDELPAISVDFGEDQPADGDGSHDLGGTIQSLLTINVTGLVAATDEPTLRRKLLDLRTDVHIAINKNTGLGLPFVLDTHYGGANPPASDVSSEVIIGELTSVWGVRYEMNHDNPQ